MACLLSDSQALHCRCRDGAGLLKESHGRQAGLRQRPEIKCHAIFNKSYVMLTDAPAFEKFSRRAMFRRKNYMGT